MDDHPHATDNAIDQTEQETPHFHGVGRGAGKGRLRHKLGADLSSNVCRDDPCRGLLIA